MVNPATCRQLLREHIYVYTYISAFYIEVVKGVEIDHTGKQEDIGGM